MRSIFPMVVCCAALWAGIAAAQSPNPVMDNYRAYRAAMDAGDLPAAESAGAAALAASEARDGDGGHTAVLALNLAVVRLSRNERAAATEPAQRALALAGGASGVDPTLATLVLGRAELFRSNDAAATRLVTALQTDAAQSLPKDAYDAAADLGIWAITNDSYAIGRIAWSKALTLSGGTSDEDVDNHAQALAGLGAVTFLADPHRPLGTNPPTGTHVNPQSNTAADTQAFGNLTEAMRLLSNRVHVPGNGVEISRSQGIYAQAMAWRSVLDVMRSARNLPPMSAPDDPAYVANQCHYSLDAAPLPQYPRTALSHYGVGVVILRLTPDENGVVTDMRIAATVGDPSFSAAVAAVLPRWRATKIPSSTPCQASIVSFNSVRFVID